MKNRLDRVWYWGALVAALTGCTSDPTVVASNCDDDKGCVSRRALSIESVDILLVVDDSPSIAVYTKKLKEQLPLMLNAITTGEADEVKFPPAKSVHVAVTTTDMGAGQDANISGCSAWGRDGTFVKPDEFGLTCEAKYPGYLSFDGGPAALATTDTVGCVPLVVPENSDDPGDFGCGFEQPLEATLKALVPKDSELEFVHGNGHGDQENEGFLRKDSLLVVLVVTDEDDCSTTDYSIFDPADPIVVRSGINLACYSNSNRLQQVERYVDNLKALRPNNDNVIFGVIAGVPIELTSDQYRSEFDLTTDDGARAYYNAILADSRMAEHVGGVAPSQTLAPSCKGDFVQEQTTVTARPPRRLLEVAKEFGTKSAVASICSPFFGTTIGNLIRAVGEQLKAASHD